MSHSLRPHELQHTRPPCPSLSPGVHTNSRPSSRWCHPAISSSVIPFSSCPQSLSASESFPMSWLFAWGGQSTGVSALASFLPSEWTGWISLQSKGLSRVFSNTTVQKHQFFALSFLHSPTLASIHDHWRFLKKLEIELPYDLAIPLLAYTPRKPELKEKRVPQCSSQHNSNSQDMEAA